MRIVVTGGSGKGGRGSCATCASTATTSSTSTSRPDGNTTEKSLVDRPDRSRPDPGRAAGADAVVHFAAIPAPGLRPEGETFRINALSTYNVFAGRGRPRMRRVVWASSETVLGLPFDIPPAFAPIDETIEPHPESSYSLSKLVGETMATQFARRSGIGFVGLASRTSWRPTTTPPSRPDWDDAGSANGTCGATSTRATWRRRPDSARGRYRGRGGRDHRRGRDVMTRPSADLMAEVFPDVPLRRPVEGRETLLAIDHARELSATNRHIAGRTTSASDGHLRTSPAVESSVVAAASSAICGTISPAGSTWRSMSPTDMARPEGHRLDVAADAPLETDAEGIAHDRLAAGRSRSSRLGPVARLTAAIQPPSTTPRCCCAASVRRIRPFDIEQSDEWTVDVSPAAMSNSRYRGWAGASARHDEPSPAPASGSHEGQHGSPSGTISDATRGDDRGRARPHRRSPARGPGWPPRHRRGRRLPSPGRRRRRLRHRPRAASLSPRVEDERPPVSDRDQRGRVAPEERDDPDPVSKPRRSRSSCGKRG